MSKDLELQPIHQADWDYLIVLDACRFDTFEEVYGNYFEGELRKVESRGSNTMEWLPKTFEGRYNYTYLSASPYVNSKGLSVDEMMNNEVDWTATDHFTRIIDIWDDYWNGDTVHPEKVTQRLAEIEETPVIAHYMQPHSPFLSTDSGPDKGLIWKTVAYFFHMLPEKAQTKIKGQIEIPKSDKFSSYHEIIAENEGEEYLRKKYRENLEIALKEIQDFVDHKEDVKIVITADHGELLGENGKYSHPRGEKIPELIHVPWLEIER